MSPLALGLVITAALLHALWNVAAKHAGASHTFPLLCSLLLAVLWAPVAAWAVMGGMAAWTPLAWALVLASGITHLVYFRTLLRGYRESDLTVVYPVARGTGPLLSSAGAMLLLHEWPTAWTLAGVLGITAGLVLIAGGPALWRRAHDPGERGRIRSGLLWGGMTGVLIALYTLIDGYSVKVLALSPILVDYIGNLMRIPFMLPEAWRDRADFQAAWRLHWKHALLVAAISPLGYILVLYAATMAPLSHVAPAREVSMLFAALIGGRLLGETDRGLRMLGAACMAGGVAALALG
ncbi:DMT family transporter [Ideonella sp. BN130291]|uniref:DMT family transporter n=1 Tax=Ideonella sp. BN130291 TaxID=3112940 RepID=UPI002E271AAC|nr:DMT family transporter [Ideonella sp. BN130291]